MATRYRKFFGNKTAAAATTPRGWYSPLSEAPRSVATAVAVGLAIVPFNTAQPARAFNYTNLGWHAPLSTAPPVAKPQVGFSTVPYNTPQLSVNFTNYGWHQALSTPAPVAKARQGDSFVPFDTTQPARSFAVGIPLQMGGAAPSARSVYYQSNFVAPYVAPVVVAATPYGWWNPLSTAVPVAKAGLTDWSLPYSIVAAPGIAWQPSLSIPLPLPKAQAGYSDVPYNTAQIIAAAYTNFYLAPLAIAVPVAISPVGFSFVPFNTVQVATEPPETGTILMPGKAGGGGFSRKRWREIQEQEAAERRAILEEQKAARDEAARVKAIAQEARAAKIVARAEASSSQARLNDVLRASEAAKAFAEQSSKEEAAFLAAMLAEIANQEDEDDAIMLLVGF